MKDFNFQLFGVLRGSNLRFDGSPSQYLIFYSNLSGRGVRGYGIISRFLTCACDDKEAEHELFDNLSDALL